MESIKQQQNIWNEKQPFAANHLHTSDNEQTVHLNSNLHVFIIDRIEQDIHADPILRLAFWIVCLCVFESYFDIWFPEMFQKFISFSIYAGRT